jgi:succinate dehydrogenase / fumarate reductase cytochrome b subunit
MAMSIMHRVSGAALAVGTVAVVWMLAAAASGPATWDSFQSVASSPLGLTALFGWSAALFYHMLNGVRHLVWDSARLFNLQHAKIAGLVVLAGALLLTAVLWLSVGG